MEPAVVAPIRTRTLVARIVESLVMERRRDGPGAERSSRGQGP